MTRSATEVKGKVRSKGPLVITCEHATNIVDPPLRVHPDDRPWLQMHWGYDIGAADVAEEIVRCTRSVGVFSRFSRLVCDPNRDPDDPTWIREQVEGYALTFNRGIDEKERQRRRTLYHDPYHATVDGLLHRRLARDRAVWLVSIHSFTPNYMGEVREMEMGVLYDDPRLEPAVGDLSQAFIDLGFETAINAPYSGFDHLMYAANRHGRAHQMRYLELEIRQDLIERADDARRVGRLLGNTLRRFVESRT